MHLRLPEGNGLMPGNGDGPPSGKEGEPFTCAGAWSGRQAHLAVRAVVVVEVDVFLADFFGDGVFIGHGFFV